jgi:cytochrome b subunit of formate dehydrogenase
MAIMALLALGIKLLFPSFNYISYQLNAIANVVIKLIMDLMAFIIMAITIASLVMAIIILRDSIITII